MKKQHTYRETAVRIAVREIGVHEIGFHNRGKRVDEYQRADDLPGVGYSWCMSFVQWCYREAGHPLPMRTASVGLWQAWATRHGWIVKRPFRGDIVCFKWDADNWPDHVGLVRRVLRLGPVLVLRTIEGNTSRGKSGSQADGGGVWPRVRTVRRNRVAFCRVPGRPVKRPH